MNWKKYWPYLLIATLLVFTFLWPGPAIEAGYSGNTVSSAESLARVIDWIIIAALLLLIFISYSRMIFYGKTLLKQHFLPGITLLFFFIAGIPVIRTSILALDSVASKRERLEKTTIQRVWDMSDMLILFNHTKGHDDALEKRAIPKTLWPKLNRGDTLYLLERTGWLGYKRLPELADYQPTPDSDLYKVPERK